MGLRDLDSTEETGAAMSVQKRDLRKGGGGVCPLHLRAEFSNEALKWAWTMNSCSERLDVQVQGSEAALQSRGQPQETRRDGPGEQRRTCAHVI